MLLLLLSMSYILNYEPSHEGSFIIFINTWPKTHQNDQEESVLWLIEHSI